MSTPGITPENTPCCKPKSFDRTVFTQSLYGVLTAGRCKPAGGRKKGGNKPLVYPHRQDQDFTEQAQQVLHGWIESVCSERVSTRPESYAR